MTNEIQTETVSQIEKQDSLVGIVAQVLKNQEARMDRFDKQFETIVALIKEKNANPVDTGVETESKPKTEDANDVGGKVTIENKLAPKPSDSQASIASDDNTKSGSDKSGLKMENKAEEGEVEEKKEEVKVDTTKESEDVKKSVQEYEFVKSVRPALNSQHKSYPTAYQVLKSITSGWNGKTTDVAQSLIIAQQKLEAGEFGNGRPTGAY